MAWTIPSNRRLGTIFNSDIDNILYAMEGDRTTPEVYRRALYAILDSRPGALAQNVGLPDTVVYPTRVATTLDKYLVEVAAKCWGEEARARHQQMVDAMARLSQADTDPLRLAIEACRERGTLILASYRMSSEDWYFYTWLLSDFGRSHPTWRIPFTEEEKRKPYFPVRVGAPPDDFTGVLDPAVPDVYEHRLGIFREVAEDYDVDGIELDFRSYIHHVSRPLENHTVLTRLVRDTRRMLDEVAARKGRERLLLGARVRGFVDGPATMEDLPGSAMPADAQSCRELGLDVETWIAEGYLDYVCPSLVWPRWPGLPHTREFADLAKGKDVGVYPTLWPLPRWLEEGLSQEGPIRLDAGDPRLLRYKNELCALVLKLYEDGADGVSTYNWYFHLRKGRVPHNWSEHYGYGPGGDAVQAHILSILHDPEALERYLAEPRAVPEAS